MTAYHDEAKDVATMVWAIVLGTVVLWVIGGSWAALAFLTPASGLAGLMLMGIVAWDERTHQLGHWTR